ncbi:MAG: hypothetical protein PHY92_03190 [Alphaproteobacteria bacterium]|nr:hypothetical protein [Alphaproteobacteria bacterium]
MKALKAHRWWLAALAAALVLLACGDPLLRYGHDALTARLQKSDAAKKNLTTVLQQLRDDAATAERLSRAIKAGEAAAYLAPADRLQITAQLEPLATASRLGRFTYTLSPEQPFKPEQASPDTDGLAESVLTFEADAPHDGDAYRFIERLLRRLPGRARLRQLAIENTNAANAGPLAVANVRLNATVDWLANGSRKAEEK